ncbi:MAG: hypothetical protein HS129_09200 [Leptospiraceae bacterium]|nr:hypothetical protein [Leptospiraceae bacterium]NUM63359.1 hypothetical protein [Ignavibacteriaceae bacterium]
MNVGFLESRIQKNDKGEEKGFLNLVINLPFYARSEFFCVENREKKTDRSPDYLVFFQKNLVGSIWNKTYTDKKTNTEKMFRSGTIFFLGANENKLNFAVFQNEKTGDEVVTVRDRERDEEVQTVEENLPDEVY